jgi:hypothetical protein
MEEKQNEPDPLQRTIDMIAKILEWIEDTTKDSVDKTE